MARGNSMQKLVKRRHELGVESRRRFANRRSGGAPARSLRCEWACRYPWLKVGRLHFADDNQFFEPWSTALLDAYSLAFGESWLYVTAPRRPDRHVRAARAGVLALLTWLKALPPNEAGLKLIKELGAWWRRVAVADTLQGPLRPAMLPSIDSVFCGCLSLRGFAADARSRLLHQLSRFSRAGPGPLSSQIVAARRQHEVDLCRSWDVPRAVRKSLRKFARVWTHGRPGGDRVSFPASTSATFESGRKAGGLLGSMRAAARKLKSMEFTNSLALRLMRVCADLQYVVFEEGTYLASCVSCVGEEGHHPCCEEVLFSYREDYAWEGLGPQEWVVLREQLFAYAAMALELESLMTDGDWLPDARQVAVEERGMKVRMVTPISSCVTYMSGVLNSLLIRLMSSDPRLDPSSELPLLDVLGRMSAGPGLVIRSVDMSRASDLIPHQVALSLAEGICDSQGWSPFLKRCLKLAVGPHWLHLGDRKVKTQGGILMGSGVTWPLLSLYNLWLWEESWNQVRPSGWRLRRVRDKCRIVGDDLLGVSPPEVSERYTSLLTGTGGSPSFGKDLQSPVFGVLVEELARFTGVPTHLPTIPVREIQPAPRVERGGSSCPPWAAGPAMTQLWERNGRKGWLLRVIYARYERSILLCRQHGLNPFLPREFGGGGFPCHDSGRGAIASLRPKWARALRCAMSQGVTGVSHLSTLQSVWSARSEAVLSSAELSFWRQAAADSVVLGDSNTELGPDHPSIAQCAERVVSAVSAAARLVSSTVVRERHLTPRRVRADLDRALEFLNSLVPYPALTDLPRDLFTGLYIWLLNHVRRRVHKVSLLAIVEKSSAPLVGAGWAPE